MNKEKKIKLFLGSAYLLIVFVFLWIFFSHFSLKDFSSYELIKANRDALDELKNSNIFFSSILFLLGTILWVLLLGFGSPVFLVGGFIFGKWLGTLLIVFGLSIGATFLYMFANFFFKDLVEKKFSSRFTNLTEKFKQNDRWNLSSDVFEWLLINWIRTTDKFYFRTYRSIKSKT